jgi:MarR-like DNA-binding transcriptional regulator SgrR of sgrS sRNA
MSVNMDELCDAIYDLVKSTHGKKNLKPMDVTKEMIAKYGEDNCGKREVKQALRQMVDSGRLTYKYEGGSYVTLPPDAK